MDRDVTLLVNLIYYVVLGFGAALAALPMGVSIASRIRRKVWPLNLIGIGLVILAVEIIGISFAYRAPVAMLACSGGYIVSLLAFTAISYFVTPPPFEDPRKGNIVYTDSEHLKIDRFIAPVQQNHDFQQTPKKK